jgi:rod shape-determining protein MreC
LLRRQTLSLLLVICLGHVLLISAQVQSKEGLPLLEAVGFGSYAHAQRGLTGVTDFVRSIWNHYIALSGAARENEALRRHILDLETQLQEQQALAGRAKSLEDVLGLKQGQTLPTLAARVIAGNPVPGALTVTIDRGRDDGVEPDMAVVATRGVAGRVIGPVAPHAARVQLLIDRHAAAAVTFEKSSAGAMVVGREGDPPLRADFLPPLADIQTGERVVTSGQDGIYPQGFAVGTVAGVRRAGTEREVTIRPAVDFSHLDIVLVILGKPPRVEVPAK